MMLDIAERIKYLRDKAGMTQTDLAKKLGVSRSAVNAWEMSLSFPSTANIIEMTKIFHVSADYLLANSEQMMVDISKLSTEEKEAILRIIQCFESK